MPSYKLIYFPIRGRAESIRMVFAVAGVQFENVRINPQEWFTNLKQSGLSPSGQLPVLEVDGEVLSQSKAILRYVARELERETVGSGTSPRNRLKSTQDQHRTQKELQKSSGLAPEGSFKLAQADMLACVISDLEDKLTAAFGEKDEEKKEKVLAAAREEVINKCKYFEKLLSGNSKQEFFIGAKLTYADIMVFAFLNSYFLKGKDEGVPEELKDCPAMSAWYELVRTQSKILKWLKNPPADIVDYIY